MNVFDITNEKIKTINVDKEEFKITAILPKEKIEIAVKRSYLQNGLSLESFGYKDVEFFDKIATVDVCVISKPNFYSKFDSCQEWPDEYVISELYDQIKRRTKILEEKLKKNRSTPGST